MQESESEDEDDQGNKRNRWNGLGDKTSRYCMLDENGEVLREASVATTKKAMTQVFATMKPCRVAIEVGTHSPWVSWLLKSLGHQVIVANARQVQLISKAGGRTIGWTRKSMRNPTCGIYARVSTKKQETELQLTDLRKYVERMGWRAMEYVEKASSVKQRRCSNGC